MASPDQHHMPFYYGEGGGGGRGPTEGEEELATRMLQIQSKRFYLDVKQNWRGRFLKIAEVGAGGRKSRLLMSLAAAAEFRDHLVEFADFYTGLGPPNPALAPEDGQLKCAVMVKENRRYYLDLKENNRGRFLRVSQASFGGPRSVLLIPGDGIGELAAALSQLLDSHGPDAQAGAGGELPEGRQLRAENKMFYFDVGQNNRGVFLRISEVKNTFRTAITVPERSWARFRETFNEICDEMEALGGLGGDGDDDEPYLEEEGGDGEAAPAASGDADDAPADDAAPEPAPVAPAAPDQEEKEA